MTLMYDVTIIIYTETNITVTNSIKIFTSTVISKFPTFRVDVVNFCRLGMLLYVNLTSV